MTSRPAFTIAVAGVATDVGKTWIAAALLAQFRSMGRRVSARKPVQSYAEGATATDAEVLASAAGEDPVSVCPRGRWYPLAMAPPMAAQRLGLAPIALSDLLAELQWPDDVDLGIVETVGGVRSPMADDGDSAAFVRALAPDHVVLVADAGVGAINSVRLCASTLDPQAFTVVLNRFDRSDTVHEANRAWLGDRDGFAVVTSVDECVRRLDHFASLGATDPDGRMDG